MLFTMRWEDELLYKATREGVFDVYFPKPIDPKQLIDFVKKHSIE